MPHRCEECGKLIQPGEQYERVDGKWDGDVGFYSIATCLPCKRIRDHYVRGAKVYGTLRECLKECLGIDYLDPAWEPPAWFKEEAHGRI